MTILFNNFIEISKVSPFCVRSYQVLWDELRDLFEEANVTNLFGINLLHKHFDLLPGELFVEKYIQHSDEMLIRPVQSNTPESTDAQPMMWAIGNKSELLYSYQSGSDMQALTPHQSLILIAALQIIAKHKLAKKFGIWRLDRYKEVWTDKTSTEITHISQRIHILKIPETKSKEEDDVIETRWDVYMEPLADCHGAGPNHYGDIT